MLSMQPRLSKLSDIELMGRLHDLSYLSAQQILDIHEHSSSGLFGKNDVIFREEDDRCPDTYILLLGTAELCYMGTNSSRTVAIVPPGVILKLPLMPAAVGHRFQLKALNECRVTSLPTTDFMRITVGADPNSYAKFFGLENGRLGQVIARYPGFVGLNVLSRTVVALMELVLDFGVRDDRGMVLRISPTHQQLADLVGASRSKVTRMLAELEDRRIIIRQGRQIVMDLSRARAFMGIKIRDENNSQTDNRSVKPLRAMRATPSSARN
jgi:CRP-like cAMP-binding protein